MRRARPVLLVPVLLASLCLGGCGAGDCLMGIAHRDCVAKGSAAALFPEDDAICRGYGLTPQTRDYAVCRQAKSHERVLTERETDYGVLQNPLTPNVGR